MSPKLYRRALLQNSIFVDPNKTGLGDSRITNWVFSKKSGSIPTGVLGFKLCPRKDCKIDERRDLKLHYFIIFDMKNKAHRKI
jgi:hypothetical protein